MRRTDGGDPRICPLCGNGQLSLKLGKHGAFIGCSNHPECRYIRQLDDDANGDPAARNDEKMLGVDPATEEEVWLKNGRFGFYLQSGSGDTLRRSSLPPNPTPTEIDLQTAIALLALPRVIGTHPETGAEITAGINRYGPFVQHERKFVRLEPDDDVLSLGMSRALTLIAEGGSRGRQRAAATVLRELGPHPDTGEMVVILEGRFGPYVKHAKTNASLPKGRNVEELTMDEAVALLAAREAKKPGGGKKPNAGGGA